MTVTRARRLLVVINDWVFFLLAIPVVTLLILSEQFGMIDVNKKCFETVSHLKSKQSSYASEWHVRNHRIPSKKAGYYEDIF